MLINAANNPNINDDFVIDHYSQLLVIAKKSYEFISYGQLDFNKKFILWRHDVDYSLNRSLKLAEIEHSQGVSSTYFINPHSDFYNLFEKSQYQILQNILELGHSIGLHFDADFYELDSEKELDTLIKKEARYLQELLGVEIQVFSFHNPTPFLLTCENEKYGGLINCYSHSFKSSVPYCSDSNGYWRFRRLKDVLEAASDPRLQILTHPGWWQDEPMSPRERIFRCIDMRAASVMRSYDNVLAGHGRSNFGTLTKEFNFLEEKFGDRIDLLDYQWMRGESASVYIEICRLLESQLIEFCINWLTNVLRVPLKKVEWIIQSQLLPMIRVFAIIYRHSWEEISGSTEDDYHARLQISNHLVHGLCHYSREELEEGIIFLVGVIKAMSEFTRSYHIPDCIFADQEKTQLSEITPNDFNIWLVSNQESLGLDEDALKSILDSIGKATS